MKKVKLVVQYVMLVAFVLGSQYMNAQHHRGHKGEHAKERMEKMTKELGLSEAQVQQIEAINSKYDEQRKAMLKEGKEDKMATRESMKALREAHKTEVEKILTTEQKAKAKELKAQHKAEMKEKRAAMKEQWESKKEERKALGAKMKAYTKENVMPVVLEQRAKLDKQMSRADRKKIDKLRTELKQMRPEMKEMGKSVRNAKKGDGEISEADKAKMKALKEAAKEKIAAVKEIAEKYEAQITALRTEISDQETQWKADLKAMHEASGLEMPKHRRRHGEDGHGENREEQHEKERGTKGKQHRGMKGHRGGKRLPKVQGVKFVLLDPDMDVNELFEEEERGTSVTPGTMKVFPNPASVSNTLEFEVKEAGNVVIELRNKDGVLVKTVKEEYLQAGEHRVQVNLSDLNDYVYFYVIRDVEGQRTQKFLIRKN